MKKIFVDFDGTIVKMTEPICETYNKLYCEYDGFKKADPAKLNSWSFTDQCSLLEKNGVVKLFEHDYFFEKLELMEGAREVLEELCEVYEVIICTIGTFKSFSKKSKWIKNNLSFIKNGIFITNNGTSTGKQCVDMSNGIFIDDNFKNLATCNAEIKICFGKKYSWNEDWNGLRANTWEDIRKILLSKEQIA